MKKHILMFVILTVPVFTVIGAIFSGILYSGMPATAETFFPISFMFVFGCGAVSVSLAVRIMLLSQQLLGVAEYRQIGWVILFVVLISSFIFFDPSPKIQVILMGVAGITTLFSFVLQPEKTPSLSL